jgi:diguanylate cyclase (GGDEF)-like protein
MEATGSWLCPTSLDRTRVVEASPRVRTARTIAASAVGVALVALAPSHGWWTLALFAVACLNLATVDMRLRRSRRPERVAAGSFLVILGLIAVGIALSGGPHSPVLSWIVIPTMLVASRFRRHVVIVAAAVSGVVLLIAVFAGHPSLHDFEPARVFAVLTLLVSGTAALSALMGAELENRDQAVLDPLTGLLNRNALRTRVVELEQQARLSGEPVCLLVCDIDGFKRINDLHGHCRGDAVLQAVALQLRRALRSFELIYRLGGEEFVVLMPGVELAEGVRVAERVRRAMSDGQPGGIDLTMSIGVAAAAGAEVVYEDLFERADRALYEAKRAGRNRVVAFEATLAASAA